MRDSMKGHTRTTRVMNAVVAGTSEQTGSAVDMAAGGGFQNCRFMMLVGTLTASQVTKLKIEGSDDNSSWSAYSGPTVTALTDAMADDDDNQVVIVDVVRSTKRYLRPVAVRGTANAVIDGIVATQYSPNLTPVTDDTATVQQSLDVI